MRKRLVTVGVMLLASLCFAGKKKPETDPIMPDVTARGRALYEYDQAAWHATDAVQALHPPDQLVGRYLAFKSDQGWTVVFGHLNEQRDRFLIGYEATEGATLQEFTVKKLDPPREDTAFYLAAAKAFDTARHDFQGEKRPYNIAVLPTPSGQLYVYVVPAQTKTEIFPLGGDVRYLMTADGGAVLEKRQLHKSIIEVDPRSIPKGATSVAGYHTHVLSDVPEDTDVFHVLTREPQRPEAIVTRNKKMYEISVDGLFANVRCEFSPCERSPLVIAVDNILLQPESFLHEPLQAGFVEQIEGEFFVGEHGEGGAFGSSGEFGGFFYGEVGVLADDRHHHADHHLQAADFAGFLFALLLLRHGKARFLPGLLMHVHGVPFFVPHKYAHSFG
jgi:hypothetical protein